MQITHKLLMAATIAAVAVSAAACGQPEPIYKATPARVNNGSLLYATMGCGGCHGPNFDGLGPRRNEVGKAGLTPSDFRTMKDPQRTPVSYFRVITAGTPKTRATAYKHAYQSLTDAGRWDLANFLYSWAPRLKGDKARAQRAQAMTIQLAEAHTAYRKAASEGKRRWEIGYTVYAPSKYNLKDLLKKTGAPARAGSDAVASNARVARAHENSGGRGQQLYKSNCAGCHGAFGEGGGAGVRLGQAPCTSGPGRCDVRYSSRDLAAGLGRFEAAHRSSAGLLLPKFSAMGAEDIGLIFGYLRSLGK